VTAPGAHDTVSATLSVGLDLVHVARVEESLERFGERFPARVFTPAEIAYCESAPPASRDRARRFAARLAAKEAAWKALGLGDRGHAWQSIEVVREPSGACAIALHGALAADAADAGVRAISLSITHEHDYAAAVVLAARPSNANNPRS
jgi:holo-[acyl-carrier protein] synthase